MLTLANPVVILFLSVLTLKKILAPPLEVFRQQDSNQGHLIDHINH